MLILHFLLVFNRNASNNDSVYLVLWVEAKEYTWFATLCKITRNNGQNSPQSVIMDGRQAHEPEGVADCLTTTKPLDSEHNLQLNAKCNHEWQASTWTRMGGRLFNNHKTSRLRTKPTTQNWTLSKPQLIQTTDENVDLNITY